MCFTREAHQHSAATSRRSRILMASQPEILQVLSQGSRGDEAPPPGPRHGSAERALLAPPVARRGSWSSTVKGPRLPKARRGTASPFVQMPWPGSAKASTAKSGLKRKSTSSTLRVVASTFVKRCVRAPQSTRSPGRRSSARISEAAAAAVVTLLLGPTVITRWLPVTVSDACAVWSVINVSSFLGCVLAKATSTTSPPCARTWSPRRNRLACRYSPAAVRKSVALVKHRPTPRGETPPSAAGVASGLGSVSPLVRPAAAAGAAAVAAPAGAVVSASPLPLAGAPRWSWSWGATPNSM
mmetsp:Transcript_95765/g.239972  ORF Transcript_95765/g.239972 Transcript_95765/m.239972 type:complete len:298 (+) Transcript_95765:288-1181(+)